MHSSRSEKGQRQMISVDFSSDRGKIDGKLLQIIYTKSTDIIHAYFYNEIW